MVRKAVVLLFLLLGCGEAEQLEADPDEGEAAVDPCEAGFAAHSDAVKATSAALLGFDQARMKDFDFKPELPDKPAECDSSVTKKAFEDAVRSVDSALAKAVKRHEKEVNKAERTLPGPAHCLVQDVTKATVYCKGGWATGAGLADCQAGYSAQGKGLFVQLQADYICAHAAEGFDFPALSPVNAETFKLQVRAEIDGAKMKEAVEAAAGVRRGAVLTASSVNGLVVTDGQ